MALRELQSQVVLYGLNGSPVGLISDGNLYRLAVSATIDGSQIDLATNAGLQALRDLLDRPAQEHGTADYPSSARLSDGTSYYKSTTPADTQPISAMQLPLPSGAATDAALQTSNIIQQQTSSMLEKILARLDAMQGELERLR